MNARILTAVFVLLTASTGIGQAKPKLSSTPLTAEEQAIYRTFLGTYSNGAGGTVNLANTTTAYAPGDMDLKGCLKGMDLAPSDPSEVHSLNADALPTNTYFLVDPNKQLKRIKQNDPGTLIQQGVPVDDAVRKGFAAGLLSLSEIAFSKDHRTAAFHYSFYCGSLCGHGGLIILQNVNGEWAQDTNKRCSVWES